jgi:hypothetical protein
MGYRNERFWRCPPSQCKTYLSTAVQEWWAHPKARQDWGSWPDHGWSVNPMCKSKSENSANLRKISGQLSVIREKVKRCLIAVRTNQKKRFDQQRWCVTNALICYRVIVA